MPNIIECKDRAEWLEARRGGIGASDVAAILGECPYRSAMDVYESKVTEATDEDFVERFYWGHAMEGPIADRFKADPPQELIDRHPYFTLVDPGEFTINVSDAYDFMRCTQDRSIESTMQPVGNLQIKNAGQYVAKDWEDGIPLNYRIQVQYEMYVLGLRWSYVAVLIGGNQYKCFYEERNDNFIAAMLPKLELFWAFVQDMKEPPVDDSEACTKALTRLHPDDNGETIALDAVFADCFDEIKKITALEKTCKEDKREVQNHIRSAIGDATYGTLADGRSFSWKTQDRKEHFVKASTSRVLRLHPVKKRK